VKRVVNMYGDLNVSHSKFFLVPSVQTVLADRTRLLVEVQFLIEKSEKKTSTEDRQFFCQISRRSCRKKQLFQELSGETVSLKPLLPPMYTRIYLQIVNSNTNTITEAPASEAGDV
jgi:hypothetical protein